MNAPTSTRALFSSTTPSNSLAMLQLEERALRLRKENIASFGAAWIKPAGISKTMQGMREEEAEREEGLAAAQQELNVAAMVAAAQAGGTGVTGVTDIDAFGGETILQQQQQQDMMTGGDGAGQGDGIGADELERDLDDDIPEAEGGYGDSDEDGLVEEGEEAYEEELMERNLDDDIPDGFPDEDDDDDDDEEEEEDYDDETGIDAADDIPVRDLDADIPEANEIEDEDMDDDIPEAEEWQHTDSELEDNDDSYLDGDHTNAHDPFAQYNSATDGVVSTNTQTPASTNPARRRSQRSSARLPPPPAPQAEMRRTRETEAQRRFLQRWSGVGTEADSDNETLASPMMGIDNDDEDDDLRASITSAGFARSQAVRSARMRQAQSRFGRFMRRGGPRDSLD